jgi:hypothetical protein
MTVKEYLKTSLIDKVKENEQPLVINDLNTFLEGEK